MGEDAETAKFWGAEAAKYLAVGGVATGVFAVISSAVWESQATCIPEGLPATCAKTLDVLGISFTSAAQLASAVALATLVLCVVSLVLAANR